MECPSCGRTNDSDRLECQYCETLLVDVFEEDGGKTDPMGVLAGTVTNPSSTDELARERKRDSAAVPRRFPSALQYTGDLPRLFRFGDRYQILEKLGEGGMGRVYKALDLELDRPVALKTIRAEKGTGPEILKRFKQELLLARKVTHKNVVRIYDLGESEGMKFFTMELVEGESLRDLLRKKKRYSVKEALGFMKQMLSGLAEAHSQGVVHRDLKPQNVMVSHDGTVRIMDFGIARTADSATITGTSEMIGTPDYISPEQVKGESADAKSDLYACGVILYEMLTGDVPFQGDTALAKVVSRLQAKPRSPRALNPEIPAYLERIIVKLMEPDPDLRYQSAEAVLQDLEREQVDRSPLLRARKVLARRRGRVALLAAIALGVVLYGTWPPPPAVPADVPVTTIAILPFHNMAGLEELEWMEYGIPEMLITDISQSSFLRPITAERVHHILRDLGKEGQSRLDGQTIQVISQSAGAHWALYGRFITSEGRLRIDMNLRKAETGIEIPIKVDGEAAELFTLIDTITEKISPVLNPEGNTENNRPLIDVSTDSLGAFRAYHQGLSMLHKGAHQAAIPFLEEAVQVDPDFAIAHAKLAEAHFHLGNRGAAQEAIRRAQQLSDIAQLPLPERYQIHAIGARIENDPQTAVNSYRELTKLYPDDPEILFSLASSLETLGELDEAAEAYRQVVDKAPAYGAAVLGLGRMLVLDGRSEDAINALLQALDTEQFNDDDETLGMIYSILGVAYRDSGRYEEAIIQLEKSLEHRRTAGDERGISATLTNLAYTYRNLGDLEKARPLLQEGLKIAQATENSAMESFALVNLGLVERTAGRLDEAIQYFRESLEIEWERKEHSELADRLNSIGSVYVLLGRYAEAMVYLEQAKVHFTISDDPEEEAYNLLYKGEIQRAKGSYTEAIKDLLSAAVLFQGTNQLRDAAYAQDQLSTIYLQQGRLREALAAVETSLEATSRLGIPKYVARSRIYRANYYLHIENIVLAEKELALAEDILSKDTNGDLNPIFYLVKARIAESKSDFPEAMRFLELSRRSAQNRGEFLLALEAAVVLGRVRLSMERTRPDFSLLEDVMREAESRRLRVLQSQAALALAEGRFREGDLSSARGLVKQVIELADEFDGRNLLIRAHELVSALARAEGLEEERILATEAADKLRAWIRGQMPATEDSRVQSP